VTTLPPEPVPVQAALSALDELTEKWGKQYGAVIRLWENAWEQFIPFLDYDLEIRTVICSLDPTGTGRTRWTMRWKPALNAFAITFADRFPSAETY